MKAAALLGLIKRDKEIAEEGEPLSVLDRSRYQYKRYAFLIDAPFEISEHCCSVLKKSPSVSWYRETGANCIYGITVDESSMRFRTWLKNGCNGFKSSQPKSMPLAFWTEQDILKYIYDNNLKHNESYGEVVCEDGYYHTTGAKRTGCFACGFGLHLEKKGESRLQNLIDNGNDKLADYVLRGGKFSDNTGMWGPYKGVGLWFVIEWINNNSDFDIWYPNRDYYLEKYMTDETKKYLQ